MSSGSPFSHRSKPGRGEQVVDLHREREPVGRLVERLDVDHADRRERRRLDLGDQRRQVERLALLPGAGQDRREQDVLAALDRVGVDPDQAEDARRRWRRPRRAASRRRAGRAAAPASRAPRPAARRRSRACRSRSRRPPSAGRCARRPRPTRRGPSTTGRRSARRTRRARRRPAAASASSIHGRKSSGSSSGNVSSRFAEVALRVDDHRRDAVEHRLLDQRDAEPGLAGAGHPDADRVGDEVLRVVEDRDGPAAAASPGRTAVRCRGRRVPSIPSTARQSRFARERVPATESSRSGTGADCSPTPSTARR